MEFLPIRLLHSYCRSTRHKPGWRYRYQSRQLAGISSGNTSLADFRNAGPTEFAGNILTVSYPRFVPE
jgi:hypothetical protein